MSPSRETEKMNHRVNVGKYGYVTAWMGILVFYSAAGSSSVCSVHFLCLLFICHINSLKMSVVVVCSERFQAGYQVGAGQSGDWFWSSSPELILLGWLWGLKKLNCRSACFSSFPPINFASAQ